MVDAAAREPAEQRQSAQPAIIVGAGEFVATVHASADSFLEVCGGLDTFAPPQSVAWVENWLDAVRPDSILVTISRNGTPVFALGLQTLRKSSFRIARVLGLNHANANFFPLAAGMHPEFDRACVTAAIATIKQARPDVHALVFERLVQSLDGRRNPLLSYEAQPSPNIALSLKLTPGFDGVLAKQNGQRKRKRHRYQQRRLETIGKVRHIRPNNPSEALRVINAFLELKSPRLRSQGLIDVFGSEAVRDFFRRLFMQAVDAKQANFVLDALEVDGKIRAVTGSSIRGNRIVCDFAAFADDDSAAASPGDYLLYTNIRDAVSAGFEIYDLGVGDEPYKRSWCDIEEEHFDVFVPLTRTGSVLVASQRVKTRLVSLIKSNATLLRIARWVRAKLRRETPS